MKVIIIEDEPLAAKLLEEMLRDLDIGVEVMEKCEDVPAGVKSIKRYNPDIVFIDIELPVYNGTQILDFFDEDDIQFGIIFTTAYNEYALKAFELSAVDYLMKPLQIDKVRKAIGKAVARQSETTSPGLPVLRFNLQTGFRKIVVPVDKGHEIINLDNIIYIKAETAWVKFILKDGPPVVVSKNLGVMESLLTGVNNFYRIHRSYLANLNYSKKLISRDGWMLILNDKDNTELPVSQEKKDKTLELIQKL